MRRIGLVLVSLVFLVDAGAASAGGLDLRVGAFMPRADSNLFADDSELYTVEKSDWVGATGGIEYSHRLTRGLELGFSVDLYDRSIDTVYRDYVDSRDRDIPQTLSLQSAPVGVTLKFVAPGGRRQSVQPYLGVGADLVFYKYEEFGQFVDFQGDQTIYDDDFLSEGVAPGFHAVAGIRIPVGDDFSITGEGRYLWSKHDMTDDFSGNRIDLSGGSVTVGVHVRF